ncbi:type II toxin-antitoxin system RelB/DinJ family antitoxin [Amphibiibacter pelophylacis]|uniref:Type II toxin-antitoxin system RelB/DinJ family antitoxin n=1 Tax=Amphibiibacter pelophylacis TaxID=1799477 RepID=A0ACC6P228_9BURK
MAASTMVHVRVDENIKAQATETLAAMGLTVSDAIRVFLTRVVADQELPFALKAPTASSRAAIAEGQQIAITRRARFSDVKQLISELDQASRQS